MHYILSMTHKLMQMKLFSFSCTTEKSSVVQNKMKNRMMEINNYTSRAL